MTLESISEYYDEYIIVYIFSIKSKNDNKHDILKHKKSKFLLQI